MPLSRSAVLIFVATLLFLAQYALASPPEPVAAQVAPVETSEQVPAYVELLSRGFSKALRAVVVPPGESLQPHLSVHESLKEARWLAVGSGAQSLMALTAEGLKAPGQPGVWTLGGQHAVITPVHFDGSTTSLNGYRIGRWPARTAGRTGSYAPPELLIEVTQQNQDFAVSEHFRLRHFLTKDQTHVWPKYLVLDLRLVDKLELVLQELRTQGYAARGLHVMSGFRTPQYNGPGENGRAKFSRHTYGDAADVWLDDDGDGQMDDLDGNGRVDVKDAEVLARAVDKVEQRVPELIGGYGVYRANRVHGPFVHIDVRGTPARWSKR